jgi:predicted CXXCH cytochrome family protein
LLVFVLSLVTLLVLAVPASAYLSTGPTSDRSWFWQDPLPQGNDLRAQSWTDADHGWSVGVTGTLLKTADGGHTWTAQDPQTTRDLTGVSFVNRNIGWVVGVSGTVLRTNDGGSTWIAQNAPTIPAARNFRSVSFFDSNVGVAVGDTGSSTSTICYTSNGGATWRTATNTSTAGLASVQMVSATTGWAVGSAGAVLKTADGGATWTTAFTEPNSAGLASVNFEPSGMVGYFVGNATLPNWTIYKTADGGSTWNPVSGLGVTGAINLTGVSCLDANNAVAVGTNGQIRRTTDGGATWVNQSQNNMASTALRAVTLIDASVAKTIGDTGYFYWTTNGGAEWTSAAQGNTATLRATWFVDADHGWVAGTNGNIMSTSDAGTTWITQAAGIVTWRGIHFTDRNNGWVVGDAGAIRHTSNGQDWHSQTSGTTQVLNGVWFTSAATGYAVGGAGTILKTTDGGATWAPKASGTTQGLNAVWFANASTGYVAGNAGVIRKTTDGGETWATSTSNTGQILNTIRGVSATDVWAAGNGGAVVKTSNGASWTAEPSGIGTQPIRAIAFADTNHGWFVSNYGIVRATSDGGATWTAQDAQLPTNQAEAVTGVYGLCFVDAGTGYLVGDSGTIRRTFDGGATWSSLQYGTQSTLNGLVFADPLNGWSCGTGGTMMRTYDGGQTWVQLKTGSTAALNSMTMTNAARGWAVGDSGVIRRTINGGGTWAAQDSGTTNKIISIASSDASRAVIGGVSGMIKYTTDAGSTWTTASIATTQPVEGVAMPDASNAWAVATRIAGNNVVWHSSDGGATWASQPTTANANLWATWFRDSSTGFAVGDSGVILKTTDGGATWVRRPTPTTLPFYCIRFVDANRGYATGGGGLVVRTTDGGATWTLQSSGTAKSLTSVAYADSTRAWIVGGNGLIMRSTDLTPPHSTLSMSPALPDGAQGWYRVAPLVQIISDKPGSSYFGWTSAAGPFSSYTGQFSAAPGARTLYYYSADPSGNAETPLSAAIRTDDSSPTAPGTPFVSAVTTSSATAAWTAGADAISGVAFYKVFVDGTLASTTTASPKQLTGLLPGIAHAVAVRTVDVAGNESLASAQTTFTTDPVDTSPLVTSIITTPIQPDGTNDWYVTTPTVTLASAPATVPADTYYCWDDTSTARLYGAPIQPPSVGTHTLYYWSVDRSGLRTAETTHQATMKLDTLTPAAPAATGTLTVSYDTATLRWDPVVEPVSGISRYEIWDDYVGSTTGTLFTVTGLTPGTTYGFRVYAVNGAGTYSSATDTLTVTTPAAALPDAPTAVAAQAPEGGYVYVDWWPSGNALGTPRYKVWRSADGVSYSVVATTTGADATAYIDTGLRSSTRYWYRVTTVDDRGESAASEETSYSACVTGRPERPANLRTLEGSGTVALSWLPVPDPAVSGYTVLRADHSLGTVTTLTVDSPSTLWVDDTAVNGQTYFYSVCAVDASGTTGFTSLEKQARPRAGYAGDDPHVVKTSGEGLSCVACHGGNEDAVPDRISIHATPPGSTLLWRISGPNEDLMCLRCHSADSGLASTDTSSQLSDPKNLSTMPMWSSSDTSATITCDTCHAALTRESSPAAGLVSVGGGGMSHIGGAKGDQACYTCHGPASTLKYGDMSGFEDSAHADASLEPSSGSGVKCMACHDMPASRNTRLTKYTGFMVCVQCHTSSTTDPLQPDIWGKLALNDDPNAKHPLLPEDQVNGARMQCQNCHNTHAVTGTSPLVDPHDPSPAGAIPAGGTQRSFCFKCHDGAALPASQETSPWADPVLASGGATTVVDIQTAYATNVHGSGDSSPSATGTAHLRSDMGYSVGQTLDCDACHDPHGTPNGYALRSDVVSADGAKRLYGAIVTRIPAGSVTPTSPVGYDTRYFCSTCHVWDPAEHDARTGAHTQSYPADCTGCHRHMKSSGTPSRRL